MFCLLGNPPGWPCRGRLISHKSDSFPSRGICGSSVPVRSTSSVAQGDSFPSRGSQGGIRRSAVRATSGRSQLRRGSPSASRARAMHPPCIVRRTTPPQLHAEAVGPKAVYSIASRVQGSALPAGGTVAAEALRATGLLGAGGVWGRLPLFSPGPVSFTSRNYE